MTCRICHRSSCTESFHPLEEQERLAAREALPDDVDKLRRMVQTRDDEIAELKREVEDLEREVDGREAEIERLHDRAR